MGAAGQCRTDIPQCPRIAAPSVPQIHGEARQRLIRRRRGALALPRMLPRGCGLDSGCGAHAGTSSCPCERPRRRADPTQRTALIVLRAAYLRLIAANCGHQPEPPRDAENDIHELLLDPASGAACSRTGRLDTDKPANAAAGCTAEEREAMQERAREAKAPSRRSKAGKADAADGERDLLAKVAEMPEPDRAIAERVHAIVMASAPDLSPKTWYRMPAYPKGGKEICFFQAASKFKVRHATFGFQPNAKFDEGSMWPVAYALRELTDEVEARLGALVKRAAS